MRLCVLKHFIIHSMYQSKDMVTFAGRENGELKINGQTTDLQIRTSIRIPI